MNKGNIKIIEIDRTLLNKELEKNKITAQSISLDLGYGPSWFHQTLNRNGGFSPVFIQLLESKYGIKYDDIKPQQKEKSEKIDGTENAPFSHAEFVNLANRIVAELIEVRTALGHYKSSEQRFYDTMSVVNDKLTKIEKSLNRPIAITTTEPKKDKPYTLGDCESMDYSTISAKDLTLVTYDNLVIEIARKIAHMRKETVNNVLSGYYEKMTNEYGVVFNILHTQFKEQYGRRWKNTAELLYIDETFRCIFFNILVSDFYNLKDKKI